MKFAGPTHILASVAPEKFIGRSAELDAVLTHARGESSSRGLMLLSAPVAGTSELLRQAYDMLFRSQGEIIPIYFRLRESDRDAVTCSLRFLQTFLQQVVAFRRNDRRVLDAAPEICEILRLAVPADASWFDALIATCEEETRLNDERSAVRQALSGPLRALAHGVKTFVIFDDMECGADFHGSVDFIEELSEIYDRAGMPFVFAGARRFLHSRFTNDYLTLQIDNLSFANAGLLAETLARETEIEVSNQSRDLIAAQFAGNPYFIRALLGSRSVEDKKLERFQSVEKTYAEELFGGKIRSYFDKVFNDIAPEVELQRDLIGTLYDALTMQRGRSPIEAWQRSLGVYGKDFYRLMRRLNSSEIVRISSNSVEPPADNPTLSDYLTMRFRLEVLGENRTIVIGEMLTDFLKRAPKLMTRLYRQNAALGLRDLMTAFDAQEIPTAAIDYAAYRDALKGLTDDEALAALAKSEEKTRLPQVVYTSNTVAYYPPIEQVVEKERSAIALGFQETSYTEEDEMAWIAAEIDSKLEANAELAEFWCDRLEMVALMCNFTRFKIWLIAPEGFSPEALEILQMRGAIGSSRKQVELLVKHIDAEHLLTKQLPANEYEIVVPMGADTELIAAHAIEEVARRHNFDQKAINQIKTALVEACINASEHSLSPDQKIFQRFKVQDGKLEISVSNRGLRMTEQKAKAFDPKEGRRGWGLKLMKTLMDEVKFENVDDGTRILMTKYLHQSA